MTPHVCKRASRLLAHDTSFSRLITGLGLLVMGASMMMGMGSGEAGYALMEEAWPLQFWGVIYLASGGWGIFGAIDRFPYWVRIGHTMGTMWLWAFITLAQFADQPLPTRMLLILPAIVPVVLVKVVLTGPRKDAQ